ncbi:MAG TPA: hypothetical protein VLA16_15115 [Ideonella sp.]|nr:hypothetical protein [Ideonella sp.]
MSLGLLADFAAGAEVIQWLQDARGAFTLRRCGLGAAARPEARYSVLPPILDRSIYRLQAMVLAARVAGGGVGTR